MTDRVARLFDQWALDGRAEGMERGHGPAARMAFDRLKLRPDSRYLDIGCGNGYTVRWAATEAPEGAAVGLDASHEMVGLAWRLSQGIRNATFVRGDFPETEPPGGPFDAIFSMEVFYYLPDLDAALRKVHDLLAPGGRFACVVDFYGENKASHSWPDDLGVPMTLLDASGWEAAIRRAGLPVIEQRRLRLLRDVATADWKVTEGSLLTLGRR
jgi:arsenite methyltransferase